MTPAEQHTAVLVALAELERLAHVSPPIFGGVRWSSTSAESLAGRRRILERHAPDRANSGALICSRCLDDHGYPDPSDWPCPDYRDAAAGLGVELGA